MSTNDLNFKIKKILENSAIEICDTNYVLTRNKQNYMHGSSKATLVEENPSDFNFVNKHVILLKSLYTQLSQEKRGEFKDILLKYLLPYNEIWASVTAFNTLTHVGLFLDAFSVIKQKIQADFQERAMNQYLLILGEMTDILKYERQIFKPNEIEELDLWVDDVHNTGNEFGQSIYRYPSLYQMYVRVFEDLFKTLNIVITKGLTEEIMAGYNPEINQDKVVLEEEFTRYSFPSDLSQTLNKIEQKISVASDDFDFKGSMDLIRSFTERLYQLIAQQVDPIEGKKVDEKDSEKVAKFFIEHKLISHEQGAIMVSLRHFLSNQGVHRLKSRVEDARLSKNMTLEFSLYLMRRLNDTKGNIN